MIFRRFLSILVVLILFGWLPADSSAEKSTGPGLVSFSTFSRIAVLDQGRVKPMDTYARNVLLQLSGKRSFKGEPAVQWLARFFFTPEETREDKLFLINNPEIPMALGIEPEKGRRYSFVQFEDAVPKLLELARAAAAIEQKQRSIVEQEILRLYENLKLYTDLANTFFFAIPHPDFTITSAAKKVLELPENRNEFNFVDIALRAGTMEKIARQVQEKDPASWTAVEREIVGLASQLYQWSLTYRNMPVGLIPSLAKEDERWLSPWDAIALFQHEEIQKEIILLVDLANAYLTAEQLRFDLAARQFNASVEKRATVHAKHSIGRLSLELLYNKLNLFLWAKLFYAAALCLFLFWLLVPAPQLRVASWILIWAGFIPHLSALLLRIVILWRPPVSNLYETFVFVGLVSVLTGLLIERYNRRWLGIMVSSICGLVFLLIANKYSAEGDTLQMLVAVLNSNFWLSTHVLSITIGYAGCCVAGIVGHVYLIQAITRPQDKILLASTYRNLVGILGFGLTMAFLGTTLGGIWADQSWGRFWGWDPKENGALLIVLWTALLFHARIGKMIGPLGMAVGSALGIIVVMWAWFGVNLLSVGLHSYGFTSGVANALIIYLILQIVFLAAAYPLARQKLKTVERKS